jgi:hypothetical protein
MSQHAFRDAADEYMLQTGAAMRRHNDEIDPLLLRCATNSLRTKSRNRRSLEGNGSEVDATQKGAHLRFRNTSSCFLVWRQVIDTTAFRHQLRTEIYHMKHDETPTDFVCELDRVPQTGE